MTKAALTFFGFAAVVFFSGTLHAQDNSAIAAADNEAVLRQANTIVLRQKLTDARGAAQRGDVAGAAKLYQESCNLAEQIGAGISDETMQAVTGLTATRSRWGVTRRPGATIMKQIRKCSKSSGWRRT